ncbi:MAG: type II toxin-antitoxin system HicA family toxin [Rhodanobacter sp.]|nr:MAG: type II toxin-antitoxin system HicA family toxin [Rhodanobacter sp.]
MVRERPVTDREFKAVLKALGFVGRPQKGTSHELWVCGEGKDYRRVTVDAHHAPYHRQLLKLMLHDAGLSKDQFFRLLDRL